MSYSHERTLKLKNFSVSVDFGKGEISSLVIGGRERIKARIPLFGVGLRDNCGNLLTVNAYDSKKCVITEDGAIYSDFDVAIDRVQVRLTDEQGDAAWRIEVFAQSDTHCFEYVDFPPINLPTLLENDRSVGGKILYPYNEGVIVSDIDRRESSWLRHADAQYPSKGNYSVFPNMVSSQMLAYLWENVGLYVGAHDEKRGVKEISFFKENGGVTLRLRIFCGTAFGESFKTDYPIVFSAVEGRWESAAERYRKWFESSLPAGAAKITENANIPDWYADSPLVITYPVRGKHDTDKMTPNKLYPYTNALPILNELQSRCDCRLLVLLMHWEGTAPWAPPYVWPPFGEEKNFNEFKQRLHEMGDMLGVYCSGFGYTLQSNLIESYSKKEEYEKRKLWTAMCAGPDGKVAISNICTDQRVGYDICPASPVGGALLDEAYTPLLQSGLDYVQILDQNHGGGQYFCYSKEHGHPPVPGAWMTERMQGMLKKWNEAAPNTLFGCESASAEPFIGNLLFSDNRFELNYRIGDPVPLYAYIYHEYVRNFMGNQVCCPFPETEETLRYRLAYSFSIGDCMTLVLSEDGDLMSHWGSRDFSNHPSKEKTFSFISNLSKFYKENAKQYLYCGKMICSPPIDVNCVTFPTNEEGINVTLPLLFHSAWETNNCERALILVNPNEFEVSCTIDRKEISVPPLDARIIRL